MCIIKYHMYSYANSVLILQSSLKFNLNFIVKNAGNVYNKFVSWKSKCKIYCLLNVFKVFPLRLLLTTAHCLQVSSVVSLNVGGVYFTTLRSTLLKYQNSMLAAMFSGRHEMQVDSRGASFIDRNGTYFGYILEFLR